MNVGYYIRRSDGDWDLVALIPSPYEGDEELLTELHDRVKDALTGEETLTVEFDDPEAPAVYEGE